MLPEHELAHDLDELQPRADLVLHAERYFQFVVGALADGDAGGPQSRLALGRVEVVHDVRLVFAGIKSDTEISHDNSTRIGSVAY